MFFWWNLPQQTDIGTFKRPDEQFMTQDLLAKYEEQNLQSIFFPIFFGFNHYFRMVTGLCVFFC